MQPFDQQEPSSQSSQHVRPPVRARYGHMVGGNLLALLVLLAVFFGTGLLAGCQLGSNTGSTTKPASTSTPIPSLSNTDIEAVREAVIARFQPAVVQINVTTAQGGGLGSGVIIDRRGYIVTNDHVVHGAQSEEVVLYGGQVLPARTIGLDPPDDLAVVQINPPRTGLTVAPLGDSSKLRVGQEVLAIGNPLGITQTVTNGIVSALNRVVGGIPDAVQTDAPINPGNSGGALVDLQGELVGVPSSTAIDPEFKTPANGVGFAIPTNRVKFIVPQLIQSGRVTNSGRASLDIRATSVDPNVATQNGLAIDHGALIVNTTPGGAADKAGLKAGDIIVQIDNQPIPDLSALGNALLVRKPGDTVTVQFYRGNQQQSAQVKLDELKIS